MSKPRARRIGITLVVLVGASLTSACATRTKSLSTPGGPASYEIECIEIGDCWAEAQRACHGSFRAVAKRENTIPENELPGLNARTHQNTDSRNGLPQYAGGIETDAPLSAAEVVVVCTSG